MNFSEVYLKQKYENKKKNANGRGISFSLTEDEFIKLCLFLKENRTCPYTEKEFVFTATTNGQPKPHYPTLERVDNTKGYEIGNVIWICYNSNNIKSKWESNSYNNITFSKADFKLVQKIFSSEDKVKEQLNKIYEFVKGEKPVATETKKQVENSNQKEQNKNSDSINNDSVAVNTFYVNSDVVLATMYSEFAEHCKEHVDFLLSFNEYKKLMNKKQCQLSMQKFDETHKRSLFVIDKTKAIEVKNLLVVDLKLRHHLDTFIGKIGVDNKTLKNIFKNLSNIL